MPVWLKQSFLETVMMKVLNDEISSGVGSTKLGPPSMSEPGSAEELVNEWESDGQDCSDLPELISAAKWLENNAD
jgi:hypothetical protein